MHQASALQRNQSSYDRSAPKARNRLERRYQHRPGVKQQGLLGHLQHQVVARAVTVNLLKCHNWLGKTHMHTKECKYQQVVGL
jgi:hypothetical protein